MDRPIEYNLGRVVTIKGIKVQDFSLICGTLVACAMFAGPLVTSIVPLILFVFFYIINKKDLIFITKLILLKKRPDIFLNTKGRPNPHLDEVFDLDGLNIYLMKKERQ